jgi:hypothetical protein
MGELVKRYEIILMAFNAEKFNLYREVGLKNGDNPSNRANQIGMFGVHQDIQMPFCVFVQTQIIIKTTSYQTTMDIVRCGQ